MLFTASDYPTVCTWLPFFSETLTQWRFEMTSILFLSDLEDHSDSMLAKQP